MGYFQVRYDSRVVNYDRRGFIRLATGHTVDQTDVAHVDLTNDKFGPVTAYHHS